MSPVVACSARRGPSVSAALELEPTTRAGGCWLFNAGDLSRLAPFESMSCMDRYVVVFDDDARTQEAFLSSFFDLIAGDYESLIEPERNRSNIEYILGRLADYGICDGIIADVGCGPGTSLEIASRRGFDVIGVEISPEMRLRAAAAGMRVISPEALADLPGSSLKGAIASYVLHLDPGLSELATLLEKLERGAPLIGNVHKGRGLAELARNAESLGATLTRLNDSRLHKRHGPYVAIRCV